MSIGIRVFVLGSTGYIGGHIVARLLTLDDPPAEIVALIRDQDKAKRFETLNAPVGVKLQGLVGSLGEDEEIVANAADAADVVINAATADKAELLKDVFVGLRRRKARTGQEGILIHTSGTGMFADDARGEYLSDKIYTDMDQPGSPYLSITSLPDTTRHRGTDLAVLALEEEKVARVYIVVPCHIWGRGQGEIFDKGIANHSTISFPWLIRESLTAGQSLIPGKGLNQWNHVHATDTADLYALVFQGALANKLTHGCDGYYLACAGEYSLLEIGQAVGEALLRLGLSSTADTARFPESDQRYRVLFTGTNARAIGERAEKIGWKPKYKSLDSLLTYMKEETSGLAQEEGRI